MSIHWTKQKSPLHSIEESEIAVIGDCQLHVEKLKDFDMSKMTDKIIGTLSDREKEILNIRFGLDENVERKEVDNLQKDPRWIWRASINDKFDTPFKSISGNARTKDEAKRFAEHSLQFIGLIDESFGEFINGSRL